MNNGEDKPKIFPQEIMALEEAPKRYTKQVHFRLHTAHLSPESLTSVQQLIGAHPGKTPFFMCFMRSTGENIFVEAHKAFSVMPSLALQRAANEQFGSDTYYVKVDGTTPPRQQKAWERRESNGN